MVLTFLTRETVRSFEYFSETRGYECNYDTFQCINPRSFISFPSLHPLRKSKLLIDE